MAWELTRTIEGCAHKEEGGASVAVQERGEHQLNTNRKGSLVQIHVVQTGRFNTRFLVVGIKVDAIIVGSNWVPQVCTLLRGVQTEVLSSYTKISKATTQSNLLETDKV